MQTAIRLIRFSGTFQSTAGKNRGCCLRPPGILRFATARVGWGLPHRREDGGASPTLPILAVTAEIDETNATPATNRRFEKSVTRCTTRFMTRPFNRHDNSMNTSAGTPQSTAFRKSCDYRLLRSARNDSSIFRIPSPGLPLVAFQSLEAVAVGHAGDVVADGALEAVLRDEALEVGRHRLGLGAQSFE